MRIFGKAIVFLVFLGSLGGCIEKKANGIIQSGDENSLSKAFADDFYVGAAINARVITEKDSLALQLLRKEFSAISPENDMKWENIHPASHTFYFDIADQYVALGKENDMFILGHTLVWHSQLADYMKSVSDDDTLATYMENHITTIVARYKGEIDAWDVVNEALNEDGTLRESIFYKLLGEEYITMAFKLAAASDPAAKLLYNDYNLCVPEKRAGAVQLVKTLKKEGIKIDGVGMQGHWGLKEPSLAEIENSILAYSALGVKVSITELDITVLPNPWDMEGAEINQNFENDEQMNPYPDVLPDAVQQQLAQRYHEIFRLFVKHSDKIDRVTFWGINDGNSWLNNWPIRGRTNYPLLFDRQFHPKEAYDRLLSMTSNN